MTRLLRLMAAVLLFAISSQATITPAQNRLLETTIRDYAIEHNFNGTILIQHNNTQIYNQSFGLADRTFSIPVNNNT